MRSTRKPSQTALLLNGAAILLVVTSVGVVLRSTFVGDQVEACRERFANGTRFSLESHGQPISAEQLQGRLAATDWGLVSGARVVSVKPGATKYALELDLSTAPSVAHEAGERAGIGFEWIPQSFGKPEAACLTYAVFVPDGFSFGKGGRLPGLLGTSPDQTSEAAPRLSTRYTWDADGDLDLHVRLPQAGDGVTLRGKAGTLALKSGRWTELQQEVVLNTPGKSDGVLRVWQDGALALERTNLAYRADASVTLSGVLAETAAGAQAAAGRGSQKILLTPFELRRN